MDTLATRRDEMGGCLMSLLKFFKLWFSPVENISASEVETLMAAKKRPVVIDVRTPGEYADGHIPGATLIPLHELRAQLKSLQPTQQIVLVCRSGSRSARAFRLLAVEGFSNLRNMAGGMMAWNGRVVRGKRP